MRDCSNLCVTAVTYYWQQQAVQHNVIVSTTEATFLDPQFVITLRIISNYNAPDNNRAHLLNFNAMYRRNKQ